MKRLWHWLLVVITLGAMALATAVLESANEQSFSGRAAVVDGDSLMMRGERIRLKGIDAPELDQTCSNGTNSTPCGRRSRNALRDLVRDVELDCHASELDRYGRWLATCEAGDVNINRWMVEQGWAVNYGDYESEERLARQLRRNIWQSDFDRPADWRRSRGSAADITVLSPSFFVKMRLVLKNWWFALRGG